MTMMPRPTAPMVGHGGLPTREWLDYLRGLAGAGDLTGIQQSIEQLRRQIEVIGERPVTTGDVLAGEGIHTIGRLPDGWIRIALAEIEDAGGGELVKVLRDQYGRVAGTSAASTDDLPEGDSNRYFPEAPKDGKQYARKDGTWDEVAAGVTSVGINPPAGVTASGSPVTSAGSISLSWSPGYQAFTTVESSKLAGVAAGATVGATWGVNISGIPANLVSWSGISPSEKANDEEVLHLTGGHVTGLVTSEIQSGVGGQEWKGPPLYGVGVGNGVWAQGDGVITRLSCLSTGAPVQFLGLRAGGSLDSLAPTESGVGLFDLYGAAYDGSEWRYSCSLVFYTNETASPSGSGTYANISTTGNGTHALETRLQIGKFGSAVSPGSDASQSLGVPSYRWGEVYAATGTINTSDAREKTTVRPLTPDEIAAASELARGIGSYQWLAMIEAKGAAARQHIGMTVQHAIEVMESHGLDPLAYGFICYDEWGALDEIRDEEGALVQRKRDAGDRYSFRMDELMAFIARGLAHRLDEMEWRLSVAGF